MQTEARAGGGVVHRAKDDGDAIWVLGSLMEFKVDAADTGGAFDVLIATQPPGSATPLHVHHHEAEAFYLLDGTMTYEGGGEIHHLEPGGFIYLPLGVPHRFRITGDGPARFLGLTTPSGITGLYRGVGRPAPERRLPGTMPSPEEIARWAKDAAGYEIEVLGPPLPEGA